MKATSNLDARGFGLSNYVEFVELALVTEETGGSACNGAGRAHFEQSWTWKRRRGVWAPKPNNAGAIASSLRCTRSKGRHGRSTANVE
jgi:hypothetical protein